jgi:hypothetical protein
MTFGGRKLAKALFCLGALASVLAPGSEASGTRSALKLVGGEFAEAVSKHASLASARR